MSIQRISVLLMLLSVATGNPDDPADGNKDHNNDGFTNLEKYINSLTQS